MYEHVVPGLRPENRAAANRVRALNTRSRVRNDRVTTAP